MTKLIEVGAGVNYINEINEPTWIHSIAEYPWDAIVVARDPRNPVIHVHAPTVIEGCSICFGSIGVRGAKGYTGPIYIKK